MQIGETADTYQGGALGYTTRQSRETIGVEENE